MKAATVVLLIAGAHVVNAEPIVPHFDNLALSVSCAEYWADPDHGLSVRIDGALEEPRAFSGVAEWASHVSFLVPPGVHEVAITAPDCAPWVQQIVFSPYSPVFVSGRLTVNDSALHSTTGAPDGFGVVLGAYDQSRGAHTAADSVLASQFAFDPTSAYGLWLAATYEHRGFALATDFLVGGGSLDGTAMGDSGTMTFHGSTIQMGAALRVGGRIPFGRFAVAAGAGLGGSLWIIASSSMFGGSGQTDADWYVPLWSALTYKPSCNVGVQVLAQYQHHVGSPGEDAPTFAAGLAFQPTSACYDRVGVAVRG
jgi:hypothetical protein